MQEIVQLRVFSTWLKEFAKNSSKLNKFLHSKVNLLIQHIIVQDQDGQNNDIVYCYNPYGIIFLNSFVLPTIILLFWKAFIKSIDIIAELLIYY